MILSARLDPHNAHITAELLLARFGNLQKILRSSRQALKCASEYGLEVYEELAKIHAFTKAIAKISMDKSPILSNRRQLIDFCRVHLMTEERECLLLIMLDKKMQFLESTQLQWGTRDHVTVYPREIFAHALSYDASGIVLAHNHPSGSIQPSGADITVTHKLSELGYFMGITLHDHITVSPHEYFSFREHGLLGTSGACAQAG